MREPDHPIWRLVTLAMCMVFVVGVILVLAEEPGWEEVRGIVIIVLVIASLGGAYEWIKYRNKNH